MGWILRGVMIRRMRTYLYADGSGNFGFSVNDGASRYFLLTTVALNSHAIAADLLDLRRDLAWEGVELPQGFHAVNNKRSVRARVFEILSKHDFRVDATILEKRKTEPAIRRTNSSFYGFVWYSHLKHTARDIVLPQSELLITSSAIGIKQTKAYFSSAVQAVNREVMPEATIKATMWPAATDLRLQVADYCSWAVQRKWERDDSQAYAIIADKIGSENDIFGSRTTLCY